ncbi:MAG: hypothetical protein BWY75_02266 [bacterium ADurb.Bin425]|nr:MAG: hypothetical protein BWY75_02266 [bacterium ADurb.Bin425]
MSVITAIKFDHQFTLGKGTSQAHRRHTSLGARIDHAHHFNRWHQFADKLSHFHFQAAWRTIAGTMHKSIFHSAQDTRMSMTKNHWTP